MLINLLNFGHLRSFRVRKKGEKYPFPANSALYSRQPDFCSRNGDAHGTRSLRNVIPHLIQSFIFIRNSQESYGLNNLIFFAWASHIIPFKPWPSRRASTPAAPASTGATTPATPAWRQGCVRGTRTRGAVSPVTRRVSEKIHFHTIKYGKEFHPYLKFSKHSTLIVWHILLEEFDTKDSQ